MLDHIAGTRQGYRLTNLSLHEAIVLASSPRDDRPDPLVEIIPGDLGDDLHSGDRACDLHSTGHEPTDGKRVERAECAPAYGLEHRSRMRFCPAKKGHPKCSLLSLGGISRASCRPVPAPVINPRLDRGTNCMHFGLEKLHQTR